MSDNFWSFMYFSGITTAILVPAFAYWRYSKRTEFDALKKNVGSLPWNVFWLASDLFRKNHDPLKASHLKLGGVGLLLFFFMFTGIFLIAGLIDTLRDATDNHQ